MQCAHKRVFCGQGKIPIITRGSRGENFQAVVAKIAPSTPTHWDLQSWWHGEHFKLFLSLPYILLQTRIKPHQLNATSKEKRFWYCYWLICTSFHLDVFCFFSCLICRFQKDSPDTVGFRTYGGGARVLKQKVTFGVLNVPGREGGSPV